MLEASQKKPRTDNPTLDLAVALSAMSPLRVRKPACFVLASISGSAFYCLHAEGNNTQ